MKVFWLVAYIGPKTAKVIIVLEPGSPAPYLGSTVWLHGHTSVNFIESPFVREFTASSVTPSFYNRSDLISYWTYFAFHRGWSMRAELVTSPFFILGLRHIFSLIWVKMTALFKSILYNKVYNPCTPAPTVLGLDLIRGRFVWSKGKTVFVIRRKLGQRPHLAGHMHPHLPPWYWIRPHKFRFMRDFFTNGSTNTFNCLNLFIVTSTLNSSNLLFK